MRSSLFTAAASDLAIYTVFAASRIPSLYGAFRLRATRDRAPPPRGRLRARLQPHLELRPVAARHAALAAAAASLHGEVGALLVTARPFLEAAGAFPVRRGERDTVAIETAIALAREGKVVVDVPRGHAAAEGAAQEARGAAAHRRGADRARGRRAARAGRGRGHRPAARGSASCASPTARPSTSTTCASRRPARPRRRRPSG